MLVYPQIDPVAVQLGPLAIRWYSLAYIGGIVLGWLYFTWLHKLQPIRNLTKQALDDTVVYVTLGIILGGRLGYVLFYKPQYYLQHPLEILQLWTGGMSYHGGMLGVIVAFWLFCRKYKIDYLEMMDAVAPVVPIGLFLGRMANFINGELFGRVTDAPLGMIFPNGGPLPRHPSQLYEAGLEGIVFGLTLLVLVRFTTARRYLGFVSGAYLVGYALCRIASEYFREPDSFLGFILPGVTMGQMLSLPMIAAGVYFMARACKREPL